MANPNQSVSFWGHLDELRFCLIKSVGAWGLGCIPAYYFVDAFLYWTIRPVGQVVFTSPAQAFNARMTLTLLGGFMIALPMILFQLWRFIGAGLTERERKYILFFGPCSLVCFLAGAVFSYMVFIPMSLKFLLSFSSDVMVPMITVDEYISFVGTMILGGGLVFELPLVLMFLAKIGIATPEFLRQKRKYAIVLILIVSALITPPDVVSQIIMAVPLMALYEIGIWTVRLVTRQP